MALVNYSDSSSDSDQQSGTNIQLSNKKRKISTQRNEKPAVALPPLPASFLDLYAANVRTAVADDPNLHGGRKRALPHIEGNWSAHIYLEWWPNSSERKLLEDKIAQIQAKLPSEILLHSHLNSDLGTPLPLHISLSRPIVLQTETKDVFGEQLSTAITGLNMERFSISPIQLAWVSNFEATRWFLVLRLSRPSADALNRVLHATNDVVRRFDQPTLYTDLVAASSSNPFSNQSRNKHHHHHRQGKPSTAAKKAGNHPFKTAASIPPPQPPLTEDFSEYFHISIAWTITKPPSTDLSELEAPLKALLIEFDNVKIKIGNGIESVALGRGLRDTTGILGR